MTVTIEERKVMIEETTKEEIVTVKEAESQVTNQTETTRRRKDFQKTLSKPKKSLMSNS